MANSSAHDIYKNLSTQGKWALWSSIIMLLNLIISVVLLKKHIIALPLILLVCVSAPLFVYKVDCLIKGNCKLYAWAFVASSLFSQLTQLIVLIIAYLSLKQLNLFR